MRNSWSRQHCLSLGLGEEGAAMLAQEAGELCSELVTDLQSKLPSPPSFLAALQHLLAYAAGLSSPLASCICAWSHAALVSLNPNCAAAWPIGEMVTGDPFTNPLVSFSLRCKFRTGDTGRAKQNWITISFAFQKDVRMLACCVPCLPGSKRRALLSQCMPCLKSLLCSSGLSFLQHSGMHLLCLQWETSIRWEEWLWFQCKRLQCGGSFSKGHQESHTLNTFT